MSPRPWKQILAAIREGPASADQDPLAASDLAAEQVAARIEDLLALVRGSDGSARLRATAALLELTIRMGDLLERATAPGAEGRGHVIALLSALVESVDRLAPAVAHALRDPDPRVRSAAADAIRAMTLIPLAASKARRAAANHPDPEVVKTLDGSETCWSSRPR